MFSLFSSLFHKTTSLIMSAAVAVGLISAPVQISSNQPISTEVKVEQSKQAETPEVEKLKKEIEELKKTKPPLRKSESLPVQDSKIKQELDKAGLEVERAQQEVERLREGARTKVNQELQQQLQTQRLAEERRKQEELQRQTAALVDLLKEIKNEIKRQERTNLDTAQNQANCILEPLPTDLIGASPQLQDSYRKSKCGIYTAPTYNSYYTPSYSPPSYSIPLPTYQSLPTYSPPAYSPPKTPYEVEYDTKVCNSIGGTYSYGLGCSGY